MEAPHLILTRPLASTLRFRQLLDLHEGQISVIPLWQIQPLDASDILPYTNIIITSQHALHALPKPAHNQAFTFYIVGRHTASLINQPACINVFDDVEALLQAVLTGSQSQFVYLRGQHVHEDIKACLFACGKHAEEYIVYENQPIHANLPDFIHTMNKHKNIVLPAFSIRTLQCMADALAAEKAGAFQKTTLVCMSANVASAASKYPWKKMHISASADLQSMADAVMFIMKQEMI